jgi:hypothetical protein
VNRDTLLDDGLAPRAGTAAARTIATVTEASGGSSGAASGSASHGSAGRQPISYCPYCAEETLFPRESGGWECRSCLRAFSVTFLGLVANGSSSPAAEGGEQE